MQSTSTSLAAALQHSRPQSTLGKAPVGDVKRQPRKGELFVNRNGQRLHSYDSEKAPYPLCYNRSVMELESMDNQLIKYLRNGSVSFIDSDPPPEKVLDLGCGMGSWIIDAAKQWPESDFVGFDLVNIQINVHLIDRALAKRITWVHGNFLTTRLPFEDDEFDHVHVQYIARGVPENKWDNIFDEINRVLRPGGSVEMIEDDAVFPFLPRWFTAPLRARPRRSTSIHYPDGTQRGCPPQGDTTEQGTTHDHALLESLYKSVFEHRFINMKPSALLPNYFITYFRHCTLGPVISFPLPPIPPLQSLPTQISTSLSIDSGPETADARMSTYFPVSLETSSMAPTGTRPSSISFSSTVSSGSTTHSTANESSLSTCFSEHSRQKSNSVSSTSSDKPRIEISPATEPEKVAEDANIPHVTAQIQQKPFVPYMLESSSTDLTSVPSIPPSLFTADRLAGLDDRSLAMHLFRSYQLVLACREALWEELKDRLRNRREELQPFGWEEDDDFEELQNRKKFEQLIERYQTDMQARASLWCSLKNFGWSLPSREPLSKAELIEEERVREAILQARQHARSEELQIACRTGRVLVGYKPQ